MAKFSKGKSGNPGGRPKRDHEVAQRARELIKQYKLMENLAGLASGAEKDSDKISATKELFNRAWGCAPQIVELDGDIPGFVYIPPAESRDEWEQRTKQNKD